MTEQRTRNDGLGKEPTDSDADSSRAATEPRSEAGPLDGTLPIETSPTIRPPLVWMAVTVVVALGLIGYLAMNPQAVDGEETARILMQVVGVIAILILIRFTIRIFILTRTEYRVDQDKVKRSYSLLLRTWEREVPVEMVRSSEFRQSRIQKLFGYGTIEINRGLGELQLENIEESTSAREAISVLAAKSSSADP